MTNVDGKLFCDLRKHDAVFVPCRQLAQSRLKACSDLRIQIDKARLREIALYVVICLCKSPRKITVVNSFI